MAKIEFTDSMLFKINDLIAQHGTTVSRVHAIKRYLMRHWQAKLIYDKDYPVGGRRFLKFKDPKQAIVFVLKYG